MRPVVGLLAFLAGLLWVGEAAAAAPVKAFVSIAPQKYFVERIGGDRVEVSVLVAPGADPHTYEPKPRQMSELARAGVYFAVGVDFEKAWMKKIAATNPQLRIVSTDEGIAKTAGTGHPHGHAGGPNDTRARTAHGHERSADPHVWLSPPLVKIQAHHIARALSEVDPAHRAIYEENLAAFGREVENLDAELKALFAASQGTRFMVVHPSWGYFAQAYGLEQVAVEIEGKDPKPAQLQELIRRARADGIRVVFAQPQFSAKSAEMIAREIGGGVIAADPLAADWAANLRAVALKFQAALR